MSKSENRKNQALQNMKNEIASELGVDLKKDKLTARESGSVGGQMVKKMIESQENQMK